MGGHRDEGTDSDDKGLTETDVSQMERDTTRDREEEMCKGFGVRGSEGDEETEDGHMGRGHACFIFI